ncbi:DUF861 domain-containing protein [Chloroflexi bacterium TSY]|nr:DUF861 domain-containing protein [Chloroflexi bacterium TSY]
MCSKLTKSSLEPIRKVVVSPTSFSGENGSSQNFSDKHYERRLQMIVYSSNQMIPDSELEPLGPPSSLGGEVIEGNPQLSARIDYQTDGFMAGIFEATTGLVRIYFPFTEHATIIEGEVTLTDESGLSHTFRPGDSYLIEQGEVILWDVQGARVRKSFYNFAQEMENPSPIQQLQQEIP